MEKHIPRKTNQKKGELSILIFQSILQNKEDYQGHFIVIKE